MRRIESAGDVAELVDGGFFRAIFAETMDRHSRQVLQGERRVVGVNCHHAIGEEDTLLRDIAEARFEPDHAHADRVARWRADRDPAPLQSSLAALRAAADDRSADLMAPIVAGFEAEATIGEMAAVLRESYGYPGDPFA